MCTFLKKLSLCKNLLNSYISPNSNEKEIDMGLIQTLMILIAGFTGFIAPALGSPVSEESYDIVVYGGTSSGVIAAVQAAKMGKSVVLIEPGNHIGGMTASGLGWVDLFNPATMGGLTKKFFHKVWKHYQYTMAWRWEPKRQIFGQPAKLPPEEKTMWVLEPHVGKKIFEFLASEASVPIFYSENLDRQNGVLKEGQRIVKIVMESGRTFQGKMFIDATYEGDLMAAAGVSYFIGREPNSLYNETLNGIQFKANSDVLTLLIDPYRIKGDPASGLLPRVHPDPGGEIGNGDTGVQAYNYRVCLTDVPENRMPIEKPAEYDEYEYEIVLRAIEAGTPKEKLFKLDLLPNRKTDSNNAGSFSMDYVGMSHNYIEADYSLRKQIAKAHEHWQRGLIWTLQNHPRVPPNIRAYFAPWGLPKDEFTDNNHWPHQLYVREARRMVSNVVINENNVMGYLNASDGIGVGIYYMDSHLIKYFVTPEGYLAIEGGMYKKVPKPYPVSYQAIVPKRGQCENILVPVCLSASHAAYGSLRLEPVYMVLGQSSATAASLAIDLGKAVQDVPYEQLRKQLLKDKQVIMSPF